jgi:hypothetical protein
MDRDPKHLQKMLLRTNDHKGTSMLEIYQNCIVFNDGAFQLFTDKKSRPRETIYLEQGEPIARLAATLTSAEALGAVPILDTHLPAAISVSGPAERLPLKKLEKAAVLLKEVASKLTDESDEGPSLDD